MLSLENEDGSLKLLAHSFPSRELLLHEANTFTEQGRLQGAQVLADPPGVEGNLAAAADSTEAASAWLRQAVQSKPGRAKIVFAHHSRLSCGQHPDNPEIDAIWQELFDANGAPLAACTVAGHNHNVGLYKPRPRNHPESSGPVPFAQGIYMMVNGASGVGFYTPDEGTMPDLFFDFVSCCVTRITLENAQKAQFDVLGFGHTPTAHTVPQVIKGFTVEL
jgi:hypothetical protein